jgi:predicted GTPase
MSGVSCDFVLYVYNFLYVWCELCLHTRHTKSYIHTTQKHNTHQTYKKLYTYNTKTQHTPDIQKVIYHTTQKHNSHQTYKELYIIQHKNTTHTRHTKSYIHTTQKHNSHQTYKKLYTYNTKTQLTPDIQKVA